MRVKCIAAIALALLPSLIFADDLPDPVGLRGDPTRLQFTGTLPASAERLRYLLAGDPDTVEAAEPEKPMAEYLSTLDRRLRETMWANGYPRPSVDVDATTEAGKIIVKLDPGRRVHCGAIDVTGDVVGLDLKTFQNRITSPARPPRFEYKIDGPRWVITSTDADSKPGKIWDQTDWATFYPSAIDALATRIEAALAESGHVHARVKTDVGADGVLHVSITYLSPRVTARAIKITGAIRNSADAVMALAGMHVGQPIDLQQLENAQQQLWDSARFNVHSIIVEPPPSGDVTQADITIDVRENDGPLIGQAFSETERVLLKSGRWLAGLNDSSDELLMSISSLELLPTRSLSIQLVTGGHTGAEASLEVAFNGGNPCFDLHALATPTKFVVTVPASHAIWEESGLSGCVMANIGLFSTEVSENHLTFNAGLGFSTERSVDDPSALQFNYKVAPAAAINLAHMHGCQYTREANQLLISSLDKPDAHYKARLSLDTGALMDLVPTNEGQEVSARFVSDKVAQDIRSIGAKSSNIHVGLSTIAIVCLLHSISPDPHPANARDAIRVIDRVFSDEAIAPLVVPWSAIDDGFPMALSSQVNGNTGLIVGTAVRPFTDRIWARGTWPWMLSQFFITGFAGRPLDRWPALYKSITDAGPIACLTFSEIYASSAHEASTDIARVGSGKLDDEAFVSDVRSILAPGSGAAVCCDRLVANLRELSPRQVDDLITGFPASLKPRARVTITYLRTDAGESGSAALTKMLASAWPLGLRDEVKSELERLAKAH